MTASQAPKLLARNVAAVRRLTDAARVAATVAGNPDATRLESGVGNCYPGLECDLRNLERRFLPFLEVDFQVFEVAPNIFRQLVVVAAVDEEAVDQAAADATLSDEESQPYRSLAAALATGAQVRGVAISGTFGILGDLDIDLTALTGVSTGPGRRPSDAWTAARLLTEGTSVQATFLVTDTGERIVVRTKRARYLDDSGALSAVFLPGELTQSLCSPWTHDFRDCGCFYWATNHPDIVQPVFPAAVPPADRQAWTTEVSWQRRERTVVPAPPPSARPDGSVQGGELRHYEINRRWQELHFVVGRREMTLPFSPGAVMGAPLAGLAQLLEHLRYAAGVELAVAQEYLAAAYSLKSEDDPTLAGMDELREDIRVSRSELMRIAIGEMRHTRAVNDVLRSLMPAGTFAPALRVARFLPELVLGTPRPVAPKAATLAALEDFIAIEAPSAGVDGLYVDILATLENPPSDVRPVASSECSEAIASVIAEGEDHFQTFLDIKDLLGMHSENDYLRALAPPKPAPGQPEHARLQAIYRSLLDQLHTGYLKGRLEGAAETNLARQQMISELNPAAHAVAELGFLVVFDEIPDPRFMPIDPPPA